MAKSAIRVKSERSNQLLAIISKYRTTALVDAYRLKTALLNQVRELYRGEVQFKYVKNSTIYFSAKASKNEKLMGFVERYGRGTVLLALSDKDPYILQQSFNKSSVELPVKAGDVVDSDVLAKAGNTGLPPGPVISDLNAIGIPTRIESGSVWITKDAVVAKRGERVSPQLASVLSKLNIKPMKAYLRMRAVLADGVVIPGELLQVSMDDIKRALLDAAITVGKLNMFLNFPTTESMPSILWKAQSEALSLALSIDFVTRETVSSIFGKAQASAALLESKIQALG